METDPKQRSSPSRPHVIDLLAIGLMSAVYYVLRDEFGPAREAVLTTLFTTACWAMLWIVAWHWSFAVARRWVTDNLFYVASFSVVAAVALGSAAVHGIRNPGQLLLDIPLAIGWFSVFVVLLRRPPSK
jgi:drug/metabolite transporter (DMT)-like permease